MTLPITARNESHAGSKKTSHQGRRTRLQIFEEVNWPFERMATDVVGPLPATLEWSKCILVFSDCVTAFAKPLPVRDQKATMVARNFVEKAVLKDRVPKRLLIDLDSNFTSKVMTSVYDLLGIKKLQTTPMTQRKIGGRGGWFEQLNQILK